MLNLLKEYAEKNGISAETGFASKDIRWVIDCGADGKFLDVIEIGNVEAKRNPGKTFKRCPDFNFSDMKAGGVTKSHFLVETADVVGLYGKKSNDEKVKLKHKYFIKLLNDASSTNSDFTKFANLLENTVFLQQIQSKLTELKVRDVDKITFSINGSYPVDSDIWHQWWRDYRANLSSKNIKKQSKKDKTNLMRCFISGELVEPQKVQPKIKKLSDVGGMAAGDALLSFKQDSFCSYELSQAENSAVSTEESAVYSASLNHLIKEHGTRIGNAKVVHWFKETIRPKDDPLDFLYDPDSFLQIDKTKELEAQSKAKEALNSLKSGNKPELHNNYYYALTLSGASGRVMVRDWMEGQFENLIGNIEKWFNDFNIIHRDGNGSAKPPKFLAVLGSTVRDLNELPAPFITKMWRVALTGEPIPQSALAEALVRMRIDVIENKTFSHARMGLMKAYHIRKDRFNRKEKTMQPSLNPNHPEPAYHCGRLMAVFARLQYAALGDVGAGVVQRYYTSASATPALVFGRLTNTSKHHLNKLDNKGLANWFESKITDIWNGIKDTIPSTLTLEQQSLFALGYYHQMADMKTKKEDKENNNKVENN
ncbi:MAG: type I-C CRISPR-associated protein Cas8c/Csd1 [Bacteroidota bacterium]|nr:type I-C CRISPR-associated protein Cas8c/Csd1 [Bacteroidota bacterium]